MAIEKGTTVSVLWWQDVRGTSCAEGEEENADGGGKGDNPRDYFIYRKSMRQIVRERHHSRKTIRKTIYDPVVPVYSRSKPRPRVAIGPFQEVIQRWLQEDKQLPTKRRAVSALRDTVPDSHVPQTYAPRMAGPLISGRPW